MRRSKLEQKMCDHCVHEFNEHEDCKRCDMDREAAKQQRALKRTGPYHRGVNVGNALSHFSRMVICERLSLSACDPTTDLSSSA